MRNSEAATKAYIAEQIRLTRIAQGMSQTLLGGLCGVTYQQIQKYENGTNNLTHYRLALIADALDTPITAFYPPIDKDVPTPILRDVPAPVVRAAMLLMSIEHDGIRQSIMSLIREAAKDQ